MKETKQIVAVKKLERVFSHPIIALRVFRELKILRLLKHDNILSCEYIMQPECSREIFELKQKDEPVFVVTELMETDL